MCVHTQVCCHWYNFMKLNKGRHITHHGILESWCLHPTGSPCWTQSLWTNTARVQQLFHREDQVTLRPTLITFEGCAVREPFNQKPLVCACLGVQYQCLHWRFCSPYSYASEAHNSHQLKKWTQSAWLIFSSNSGYMCWMGWTVI